MMVVVLGAGVPLLIEHGLSGLAIAIGAGTVTSLVVRVAYLTKLFPALDMVGHVARAVAPTALAAAPIVVERLAFGYGNPFSAARAAGELTAFVLVAAALSWRLERTLLLEAVGYLRRARTPPSRSAPGS
jgi:hypothetical protein